MANYPLLIKGIFSNVNGTDRTLKIAPNSRVTINNTLAEQRGNAKMFDIVTTAVTQTGPGSFIWQYFLNLFVGGIRVISNGKLSEYQVNATPRSYELLQLDQPGGQTVQADFENISTGDSIGAVVHVYYENPHATHEVICARNTGTLKQRTVEFDWNFAGAEPIVKGENFTIPTGIGNVVAIELFSYPGDENTLLGNEYSLISMYVNGESVIEDASTMLFSPVAGRPGLIFPIVIRPGSTVYLTADTTDHLANELLKVCVRFYFDDDLTGRRVYA